MTARILSQGQSEEARREQTIKIRKIAHRISTYVLMSFIGFLFLFPIIFMVVAAFKPNDRVIADLSSFAALLPNFETFTFDNVRDVFSRVNFERYMFNSLFLTLTTVIAGLFINSMAAYVLSRMRWLGRAVILSLIVSLIIIPLEAIAVPLMMMVNRMGPIMNLAILAILVVLTVLLWNMAWSVMGSVVHNNRLTRNLPMPAQFAIHTALSLIVTLPLTVLVYFMIGQIEKGGSWLNSYHVQILPFIAEPFSIFLFYQFFINVPKDFDEAAYVDGAGYFRIYWQIIVPISRPVFATVAILKFLQFWSFYLWPLMVTREDTYRPLMVGMDFFQTQAPIRWGSIMAYAAMVTIPVLITFLLFQKWFVQSVSSSGVKG